MADKLSLVETRSGNFSVKVACGDGSVKTLHSLYDPVVEAKTLADALEFDGKGILVVLGLGLGYHVAELAGRFPEAEIIVVEARPEISELAKTHGPQLEGGIEIITGLPPEESLREITLRRMRNGIKRLSVFTLQSSLSAFPDYYQPVLASLKKTISVRLWDRLRYPKFTGDVRKILLLDSGYFLVREIERTIRSAGYDVAKLSLMKGGAELFSRLTAATLDFKPDFVLTMNHLGFDEEGVLTSFLSSIEMPVASWYVDSPNLIVKAFDKNVSPCTSLFLWDRTYMGDMKAMGFESVSYLPLATDIDVFKPMKIKGQGTGGRGQGSRVKDYGCDVGFVGNSMISPVEEWMEKVNAPLRPVAEEAAERLFSRNNVSVADVMNESGKKLFETLDGKEKMDFEAAVFWKATLLYRLSCVRMLEGFDVHIHGDGGWKQLLNNSPISFKLLPPLNYYKDLPLFYSSCKINFNATSRQMIEAVNQRVFDVPACGAFLMTDCRKGLEDLFRTGEEITVYRDRGEIPEIVKFFLNNPVKRDAVAQRGRDRVLKEHTYRHRLETMVRIMKGRYA
ncbi:MAG: glycosyltransferase [Nitrospirae bacterium]|nr:glycosyltransferase [Nitrospirota bacterium]